MPELSIIIVNWNCLDLTLQCLRSLESHVRGIDYEVIVVDNASHDAPCEELVRQFPAVRLLLSDQNLGFGRANNLGAEQARGQILFFLNPDTVVRENAVARMFDELRGRPIAGALACKLLNPDGTAQVTCTLAFPNLCNQLLAIDWLQERWPKSRLWGKQPLYASGTSNVHEIQVTPGAAFMVPRKVFEAVGGFHPAYFMYAEEVDLCHAIHKARYKIFYVNDAEIIHYGGQSTQKCDDGFSSVMMRQSVYIFFARWHGKPYARLYRLAMLASAGLRLMLLFFAGFIARGNAETISRTRRKWSRIALWALGRPTHRPPAAASNAPSAENPQHAAMNVERV